VSQDLVGRTAGPYQIHALIGRGGMGATVYHATHGTLVNGHRTARRLLRYNDVIRVGETDLIFWTRSRS
jgi:hypothetical protein